MSVHSFLPISLVYLRHPVLEMIDDRQINRFALVHFIVFFAAPFKLYLDVLHPLKESNEGGVTAGAAGLATMPASGRSSSNAKEPGYFWSLFEGCARQRRYLD